MKNCKPAFRVIFEGNVFIYMYTYKGVILNTVYWKNVNTRRTAATSEEKAPAHDVKWQGHPLNPDVSQDDGFH